MRTNLFVRCAAAGVLLFAVGAYAAEQEGAGPIGVVKPPPASPSSVMFRPAEIRGQVFIASEATDKEEVPARNVVVQVRDPDETKVFRETKTDDEGFYTVRKLPPGRYRLVIGGLHLNLEIVLEEEVASELAKTIIVILPKQMASIRP